ncbi:hypothetical protein EPN83_01905 [Patescibacteria group bacterium]|nr:MAG: hypothetical protein EPN83_01905 [Patescibacteria group bacterium]
MEYRRTLQNEVINKSSGTQGVMKNYILSAGDSYQLASNPKEGTTMSATTTQYPTVKLVVPTDLRFDKRKDGWELVEDVPLVGEPTLGLVEFLREGESWVKGDVMLERAKDIGNRAGQRHAEHLLSQQETIPEEYRRYFLAFPGTVWRDPDGGLSVTCLDWGGGRWDLYWGWFDSDWIVSGRLVRVCE